MWKRLFAWSVLGVALSSVAQVNLRSEVAKPLQAAQEAIQSKQPEEALKKIQEARQVAQLTAAEKMLLERLSVVAAMNAQKFDLAASSLDYLLQSKDLPEVDRLTLMETMVSVSLRTKDYPRVVEWSRRYLQQGGTNRRIRLALMQSLAVQGAHQEVLKEMPAKLQADAAAGKLPDEAELRMYAFSQQQVKDEAAYVKTLTELVKRFPSQAYWGDLLNRVPRQAGFNARYQLDVFRLMDATDNLEDAEDYADVAQAALKAGLPHEAQRMLDKVAQPASAAALKKQVQQRIAEDDKAMQAIGPNSEDAVLLAQWADVQLSKGAWKAAVSACEKALAKGGLRREAETRLHCGIAMLKSGQTDAAKSMLLSVKGDDTATLLASLWLNLAK
jgi:tetratricopeptide (TPR) repeat protein